jgi:hypothetical protein
MIEGYDVVRTRPTRGAAVWSVYADDWSPSVAEFRTLDEARAFIAAQGQGVAS